MRISDWSSDVCSSDLDFCIQRNIAVFQGGAQGEHKLSRGLEPVKTWSAHWVRDQRYALAIEQYLERETPAIDHYLDVLHQHSPFKKEPGLKKGGTPDRSEEHTSELQSLMRISYAVFCLKKKK